MTLETFPYGDHDLQTVTVAHPYPAPASTENDTGYWVILIHGGAWRDPTQTATSYLTPALAILSSQTQQQQQPITGLASISYRLSPHPSHKQDLSNLSPSSARIAKHPDHIADVQAALSFLEAKYKIGGRYVLVGHSCGATLAFQAVMKSMTPTPLVSNAVACCYKFPIAILGMAGIYNLRFLRDSHRDISAYQEIIEGAFGGDESVWDAVSPGVVGVDAWEEGRVVVLAHSEGDELCNVAQSEGMKQRLEGWEEDRSSGERKVHFLSIEGKHDEAWEKGTELARAIMFTLSRLQETGV